MVLAKHVTKLAEDFNAVSISHNFNEPICCCHCVTAEPSRLGPQKLLNFPQLNQIDLNCNKIAKTSANLLAFVVLQRLCKRAGNLYATQKKLLAIIKLKPQK